MTREVKKIYDFFTQEKHLSELIQGKVYCTFIHTTSYEKRLEAAAAVYFYHKGQIPSLRLCNNLFIGHHDFTIHVAKMIQPRYKPCNPRVERELSDAKLDGLLWIKSDRPSYALMELISRGWDEVVKEYHRVRHDFPTID